MVDAIAKLVVTVPAAAAVIITAWMFLRAQRDLNLQWEKTVRELAKEANDDRNEQRKVITENTKAMVSVCNRLAMFKCARGEPE